VSGSDSTGNGSAEKPYKTLTKALAVVKNSTLSGLGIQLAPGSYTAASGEIFPIVIPTGVTITGSNYGAGFARGSFINGIGEDKALEKLLGTPSLTAFASLEVAGGVSSVSINNVYVGVTRFGGIGGNATYTSLDVLGSGGASHSSFGAGTPFKTHPNGLTSGVELPSGNINCVGCMVGGGSAAILAYTVPSTATAPVIALSGQVSQSTIGGDVGIYTDATATTTAAFQSFQSKRYGYSDGVRPLASPSGSFVPAPVDFGNGSNGSQGGNSFINVGSHGGSGIFVTQPGVSVVAEGNYFTPNVQFANSHGLYGKQHIFSAGARGPNVTIAANASGAAVTVGPIPPPTPSPSPQPTGSPTTSPSASPT